MMLSPNTNQRLKKKKKSFRKPDCLLRMFHGIVLQKTLGLCFRSLGQL
uniref:Uncharacterized protein n=1 Tax=Populus trichocarpa TaxID=3694 RepID=A9PES6_POPTR|nr:unknown [Populus trichocarpa]